MSARARSGWILAAALTGCLAAGSASAELSEISDPVGEGYRAPDLPPDAMPPGTPPPEALRQFASDMGDALEQIDAMLFPPAQLETFQALDPTTSCADLYRELNQRVPYTVSYRRPFTDEPVNATIGFLGTLWWPAWLLWGIPEFARYRESRHIANNKQRVAELRALSAEKMCWIK